MRKIGDRTLTLAQKQKVLEKYDFTCGYCFGPAEQVEHILPWSYSYDDSEENLIASCWLCNLIASNKIFDTFLLKQEYIQAKRYYWIKRNPIPLWIKSEIEELKGTLRSKVEISVVILDTEAERKRVKRKLLNEGFRVIDVKPN